MNALGIRAIADDGEIDAVILRDASPMTQGMMDEMFRRHLAMDKGTATRHWEKLEQAGLLLYGVADGGTLCFQPRLPDECRTITLRDDALLLLAELIDEMSEGGVDDLALVSEDDTDMGRRARRMAWRNDLLRLAKDRGIAV